MAVETRARWKSPSNGSQSNSSASVACFDISQRRYRDKGHVIATKSRIIFECDLTMDLKFALDLLVRKEFILGSIVDAAVKRCPTPTDQSLMEP